MKGKRCWSKENHEFDHWVGVELQANLGETKHYKMDIGFITIMQKKLLEWVNEFPWKKVRKRINEYPRKKEKEKINEYRFISKQFLQVC